MQLGKLLQGATAKRMARVQLTAGVVLKLSVALDDRNLQHDKRFVVITVSDDDTKMCVMNSEIHALILKNERLLKCQVTLAEALPFVEHESHLDCSRLRTYKTFDIVQQLADDPRRVLGRIPEQLRDDIRSAIQHSQLIAAVDIAVCCGSLDAITFGA